MRLRSPASRPGRAVGDPADVRGLAVQVATLITLIVTAGPVHQAVAGRRRRA